MDPYGDTAVMHNDMQHDYFQSGYHPGGVLTPDIGLDYLRSPDWYPQWSPNDVAHQQPWYSVGSNDLSCHTPLEYPMAYSNMAPFGPPLSPQISPRTSFFPRVPAQLPPQISPRTVWTPQLPVPAPPMIDMPVPSIRQKRKRAPETIDCNEQKKPKMTEHNTTISAGTSSPQSSMSSPSEPLSTRAHYAVEKRYRSTLNERYATLARIVSNAETMEICRTEMPDWEVPTKLEVPDIGSEKVTGKRQSKTTTLSVALDTIELLDRACARKAREYQELSRRLSTIASGIPGI